MCVCLCVLASVAVWPHLISPCPFDVGLSALPLPLSSHECNAVLATTLASHGWVVVCVGHHDGSAPLVRYEDGRTLPFHATPKV